MTDYREVLRVADGAKPKSIPGVQWRALYADLAAREVAKSLDKIPADKIAAAKQAGTYQADVARELCIIGLSLAMRAVSK